MFGTGTIVKYIVILVIAVLGMFGVNHIMNLRADLVQANANAKTLKDSMILQGQVIAKQEFEVQQTQAISAELARRNVELDREVQSSNRKFNTKTSGDPRDFGTIARAKPGLVNNLVNSGTADVNRCIELASGAVTKENEFNEQHEQHEQNKQCKDLVSITAK